jgi:prepilin-type N-terminal cleavage/methylation domain-containing protein
MALEYSPRTTSRRPGLTLVELVVVMAILVALAGIIIPLIPGLIGRAETSGRATNSQEIFKAIQTYEASYTRYPSDWDALTDGTTTPLTYVNGFTGTTPPLAITALTAGQSAALSSAGITRLQLMATTPTGTNETFNPYADVNDRTTQAIPITSTSTPNVVTLTNAGQFQLGLSDNASTSAGTFVVVGFGRRCSLVGTGANEAAVNFFDNAGLSPDTRYSRYGIVFAVAGFKPTSPTTLLDPLNRAKLVRVFRFGSNLSTGTGDAAIQSYWVYVRGCGGS